ncbi:hypothetical protein [Parafannyhessea umbonata]|uniref:hypothetical protein n=1 Tax=Parafannyhessea umbonata TaxID=604330 RepID=UPI00359C70D0
MTDEDRREVAERLRERPVARNIKEAYVSIVQTIGVRPCLLLHEGESGDRFDAAAYADALDHLADLIDPTCHVVTSGEWRGRPIGSACSVCHAPIYRGMRHCSQCGCRVVDGDADGAR